MTKSIVVNQEKYLPSTVLAKQSTYTADYISRLAREGKIAATKIDRQWFISPSSLDHFSRESEVEKQLRQNQLRVQRKIERAQKPEGEPLAVVDDLVTPAAVGVVAPSVSFLQAVAVMAIGVLTGWGAYASYGEGVQPADVANMLVTGGTEVAQQAHLDFSGWRDWFGNHVAQTHEAVPDDVAVTEPTAVDPHEALRASFSDTVEITTNADGTTTVRPVFADQASVDVAYEFVINHVADEELTGSSP